LTVFLKKISKKVSGRTRYDGDETLDKKLDRDPYAKVKPKADSEAKHKFTRDAEGRIVVKNLAAYWLPELKLTEEIGGTEYTVTGSYDGDETLDKKLDRILKENLKEGIREDSE
jgi:hypothetical protein